MLETKNKPRGLSDGGTVNRGYACALTFDDWVAACFQLMVSYSIHWLTSTSKSAEDVSETTVQPETCWAEHKGATTISAGNAETNEEGTHLVSSSETTREAGFLGGHECQGRAELAQRSC